MGRRGILLVAERSDATERIAPRRRASSAGGCWWGGEADAAANGLERLG